MVCIKAAHTFGIETNLVLAIMNNNAKALTENGSKMIIVIMMIMIIIMMVTITHLFPMHSFLPPENIRKP